MLKRLISLWLLIAVFCLGGCGPEDDGLAELIEDSPFRNKTQPSEESLFITCDYQVLELPAAVAIDSSSVWKQYRIEPDDPNYLNYTRTGFLPNSVRRWNQNGFDLAIAPIGEWQRVINEFRGLNATVLPHKIAIYQSERQNAEVPAYVSQEACSLFTASTKGELQGISLEPGMFYFQVNCLPTSFTPPIEAMSIKIVPAFRNANKERVLRNLDVGFMDIYPETVFDEMTLTGSISQDYFLMIALRDRTILPNSLGEHFLYQKNSLGRYQLVYMLAPKAKFVEESRVMLNNELGS